MSLAVMSIGDGVEPEPKFAAVNIARSRLGPTHQPIDAKHEGEHQHHHPQIMEGKK